jgi:hypothetical protein
MLVMVFVVVRSAMVFFVGNLVVEGPRAGFMWGLLVGCLSVCVAVLKVVRRTVHCCGLLVATWWWSGTVAWGDWIAWVFGCGAGTVVLFGNILILFFERK